MIMSSRYFLNKTSNLPLSMDSKSSSAETEFIKSSSIVVDKAVKTFSRRRSCPGNDVTKRVLIRDSGIEQLQQNGGLEGALLSRTGAREPAAFGIPSHSLPAPSSLPQPRAHRFVPHRLKHVQDC